MPWSCQIPFIPWVIEYRSPTHRREPSEAMQVAGREHVSVHHHARDDYGCGSKPVDIGPDQLGQMPFADRDALVTLAFQSFRNSHLSAPCPPGNPGCSKNGRLASAAPFQTIRASRKTKFPKLKKVHEILARVGMNIDICLIFGRAACGKAQSRARTKTALILNPSGNWAPGAGNRRAFCRDTDAGGPAGHDSSGP